MKKAINVTTNDQNELNNCDQHLENNLNVPQHPTAFIRKPLVALIMVGALVLSACNKDKEQSPQEKEIAELRATVAPFKLKAAGVEAGYDQDVTGYRTHMGHHFLNVELLDNKFE